MKNKIHLHPHVLTTSQPKKSMKANTIILEGGLGNRMRVTASAYAMAKRTGIPMRVLWTKQWGMRCRFDELFKADLPPALPVREGAVTFDSCKADACSEHSAPSLTGRAGGGSFIRDARGFEKLLFARPTLKNLHAPHLLQRLCYRHIIYAPQIWYLNRDGFDYEAWFRQGGTLMTAYRDFCPWTSDDLRLLFRPNDDVRRLIDERCRDFTANTIGIHIRRTDHQQAIDESPLELFFEAIDKELEAPSRPPRGGANKSSGKLLETIAPPRGGREGAIYLATDDEATKAALRRRYGKRVITSDAEATRESTDGIRDALVEMYALSRTRQIYGSAGSTFSPIAACLGDVPITILQRDGHGDVDLLCPLPHPKDTTETFAAS